MNAVIKYPGAKWSMAQWIVGKLPPHYSYLEPFFGSGAVLFNKPRSHIETVNDLDGNVVNFFRWIRDDPERLTQEIYWTPYARQAYDQAYDFMRTEMDSLRRAVSFSVRMMQGTAFMLVLLFALCADGLVDKLGLVGFAAVGLAVLGAAGMLVEVGA